MANKNSSANIIADIIRNGGVVILPAGTVYGIFCDALDKRAVSRIFRIKSRSSKKPLQVFLPSVDSVKKYAVTAPLKQKEIMRMLPGRFTVLLKARKKMPALAGSKKIGVRVVRSALINGVLKKLRKPLAATSANISGKKPPVRFVDIPPALVKKVDHAVRNDRLVSGRASTVVDLSGKNPVIVRK